MKLLEGINGLFARLSRRGESSYDPTQTVNIIERMQAQGGSDDLEVRPLPIIGVLQPKTQMTVTVSVMVVSVIIFGLTVVWESRLADHNALYRTRSTEMQMLSQQMARAGSQAVLAGNPTAFDILQKAYEGFDRNLDLLINGGDGAPGSYGKALDELEKIDILWKESFLPNSAKPTVDTIVANKALLVKVGASVEAINANDAKLLQLSMELVDAPNLLVPPKT